MITDILSTNCNNIKKLKNSLEDIDSLNINSTEKEYLKKVLMAAFKEDVDKLNAYNEYFEINENLKLFILNIFKDLLTAKYEILPDEELLALYQKILFTYNLFNTQNYSFINKIDNKYKALNVALGDFNSSYRVIILKVPQAHLSSSESANCSKLLYRIVENLFPFILKIIQNEEYMKEMGIFDIEEIKKIKKEVFGDE